MGQTDASELRRVNGRAVPALALPTRRGLNRLQSANYIGCSATKFDEMVDDGRMPGPKRIDGRKVWDVRELDLAFEALPGGELATDGHRENSWDRVL